MSFGFGGKQPARAAKAPVANTFDLHAMIQQEQSQSAYDFSAPSGSIFGQPAAGVFGGGMFGITTGGFEAGQPVHRGGGFGADDLFYRGNPGAAAFPGEGMGKRMVTVEVTGMQSATLRSGKATIAKPQDLEAEGSAILDAFRNHQAGTDNVGTLMHTTVSGRLLDASTGALVVEVYPFVARTWLTATQTNMSDWVGAVRNELAAGVHPAPCALYARSISKGVDAAVPSLSGADVLSVAKALLGDGPTPQSSLRVLQSKLHWLLSLSATIASSNKSPAVASVDEEQPKQHQQEDGAVKEQNMDYCGRYDDIKILTERVYGMALLHCQIDPGLLTRELVEGCRTLSGAALHALLEDPHQLFLLLRSVEARMCDGGSVAALRSPHSSRLMATPSGHPELEKQQLGELLYPKVLDAGGGDHTAKITGMLLELEQSEVIVLIGNRTSLRARVEEATRVLAAHSQHHHANHGEETAGAQPRRRTRH